MVVRGRTRNAIGPQGRVGSTPTISAKKAPDLSSGAFLQIKITDNHRSNRYPRHLLYHRHP